MRTLALLLAATLAAALLALAPPPPAATAQASDEAETGFVPPLPTPPQQAGLPDLDELDPIRFDYGEATVESFQVPVRLRESGDSRQVIDQIWIDVIRPATDEKIPAVMMASPYYNTLGRGWRGEFKTPASEAFGPFVGAPGLGSGDPQVGFPEWYDEYFVPRGYAYVAMDLRGTRNSSGCQVYGDRDEVYDAVDVIDWIADQDWSNGKVAMTGGSYDGTIANGVAAEQPISGRHPEALAAATPIRAIGRWYDYHFFNGVQSSSHQATPALFTAVLAGEDTQNAPEDDVLYPLHVAERKACIATLGAAVDAGYASPYQDADAPFWSERSFTKDAAGMNTAILFFSGLFDYNVKSNNYGYLWESLPEDLPKRLVLYNGDHLDPHTPTTEDAAGHVLPFPFRERFVEATHRWYLQFLKGVDAGALREPEVEVQGADGAFRDGGAFPASTEDLVLYPTADGGLDRDPPAEGIARYADGPQSADPDSVTFTSDPFPADTRVSGQLGFDLDFGYSGPDTTVAVEILSVPEGADPDDDETVVMDGTRDAPLLFGYAWYRDYYRDSIPLRGLSTPTGGSPHLGQPDRSQVEFGSLYTDVVIPEGNRLALRFSNSAGGTVAADTGGTIRIHAPGSRVLVPTAPTATPIDLTSTPVPGQSPVSPAPTAAPAPTAPPAPAPAPTASPAPTAEPGVVRAGGEDRVATAIAASRLAGDAATTVLLARADEYADALTGAPLAADLDAPLLLTGSDALDERTLEEVRRLDVSDVVLLGGTAALAPAVEDALTADGRATRRLAGADRFATAVAIAEELGLERGVLLTEGAHADRTRGWPDALSASALGALDGRPVLLATRDQLPDATAGVLTEDVQVTVVGGPAALSPAVAEAAEARAGDVVRIAGEDRYATSALAADAALARGASAATTTVATGLDWPDGLTASALAGRRGGVLLLVDGEDPDGGAPARAWLGEHADAVDRLQIVGGAAAVSDAVAEQLAAAHR